MTAKLSSVASRFAPGRGGAPLRLAAELDDPNIAYGINPPKTAEKGKVWVMAGNSLYQTNDHRNGSTDRTVPMWRLIADGSSYSGRTAAAQNQPGAGKSESKSEQATPAQLASRREAFERAKQRNEDQNAARVTRPLNPTSGRMFEDMAANGRDDVAATARQQAIDELKTGLGLEEMAMYGSSLIDRTGPGMLKPTDVDSFGDTLAKLERIRKMIA